MRSGPIFTFYTSPKAAILFWPSSLSFTFRPDSIKYYLVCLESLYCSIVSAQFVSPAKVLLAKFSYCTCKVNSLLKTTISSEKILLSLQNVFWVNQNLPIVIILATIMADTLLRMSIRTIESIDLLLSRDSFKLIVYLVGFYLYLSLHVCFEIFLL